MKTRLDQLLLERGLAKSREEAQRFILAGEVWSGERRLEKPGMTVEPSLGLEVRGRSPFVSRAALKLQHALDHFGIDVTDRICLDVGASTGGFTDCLLQRGARHVFAVDVGFRQLDAKLTSDPRVTSLEKTNARFLTCAELAALNHHASEISFVCIDVSFISLRKVLPHLAEEFPRAREWVCLFKPQFEVGRENVGKGGRVRSQEALETALGEFQTFVQAKGFKLLKNPEFSPLPGKKSGNLEVLFSLGLVEKHA